MIRCFMDATIDPDSKCAYCCIYCNETFCEYRCIRSKVCKTEKAIIESDCPDAYEE